MERVYNVEKTHFLLLVSNMKKFNARLFLGLKVCTSKNMAFICVKVLTMICRTHMYIMYEHPPKCATGKG